VYGVGLSREPDHAQSHAHRLVTLPSFNFYWSGASSVEAARPAPSKAVAAERSEQQQLLRQADKPVCPRSGLIHGDVWVHSQPDHQTLLALKDPFKGSKFLIGGVQDRPEGKKREPPPQRPWSKLPSY
jgi:hypothetical protein